MLLNPESFETKQKVKWRFGNIPVVYESSGLGEMVEMTYLPPYLTIPPKVGDIIESTNEHRFEVKEIVHIVSNNIASLKLSIGKPTGGISPTSGGGGTEGDW